MTIQRYCAMLNAEYESCCMEFYNRQWENCPKCGMSPMLGTYLRVVNCFSDDFTQNLTLTCKCGTYPFKTKKISKLSKYWNAHCFSLKADIKR